MLRFIIVFSLLSIAYGGGNDNGICAGCPIKWKISDIMKNKFIMAALDVGVDMVNAEGGRINDFRLVRHSIISGTSQVVAGIMYRVKIKMVESNCKNIKENDGKGIELCPAKKGLALAQVCTVSLWSRPWRPIHQRAVLKVQC